jgi:hypothetical protein
MLLGDVKMTVGTTGFSGGDAIIEVVGITRFAVQLLVVQAARTLLPNRVTVFPGESSVVEYSEVGDEYSFIWMTVVLSQTHTAEASPLKANRVEQGHVLSVI